MGARVFVWLGGALFVASLAYCAYSFIVPWSHPSPATPETATWFSVSWNATLLSVFALHHSLLARERAKQLIAEHVPPQLIRSVYVWTASALLILVCAWWRPIGGELYRVTGAGAWGFGAVQACGLWLTAMAVRGLDPLELAGIHPLSEEAGALQVTGPYGIVRHPLYLGWVLMVFGAAHMTGDRLAFAVITTLYLVVAVPWEERSLGRTFGDDYARYQRAVRWRIVPFIY